MSKKTPRFGEELNSAAEEYFHLDSQACWLLAVVGLILIAGAIRWWGAPEDKEAVRARTRIAMAAILAGVVMVPGSYLLYRIAESGKDARDVVVLEALKKGGVTFEGFQDQDTERIRVSVMVQDKEPAPGEVVERCDEGGSNCVKCEATFNVDLGHYKTRWPLKGGSGRYANEACRVSHIEDNSGVRSDTDEGLEGTRSMYIDKIFAPVK